MWGWRTAPSCYNKRNKHGDIKSVNSFPPPQRKYTKSRPLTNWKKIMSKHFQTYRRPGFDMPYMSTFSGYLSFVFYSLMIVPFIVYRYNWNIYHHHSLEMKISPDFSWPTWARKSTNGQRPSIAGSRNRMANPISKYTRSHKFVFWPLSFFPCVFNLGRLIHLE